MASWVPASRIKGLFSSPAEDEPPPIPPDDEPPPPPNEATSAAISSEATTDSSSVASKAMGLAASLAKHGKAAAQLVAKQAERTKLVNVNLPAAYQSLGRHIHGTGNYRDEFPDVYQKIEGLLKDITTHSAAAPRAEGFAAKANAAVKATTDMAHVQTLKLKVNHALADLGKAAFEKCREKSGPAEVVQPIIALHARIKKLDAEIGQLSQPQPGQLFSPKRIAIGGVAVAVVAVLILVAAPFSGTLQRHAHQGRL